MDMRGTLASSGRIEDVSAPRCRQWLAVRKPWARAVGGQCPEARHRGWRFSRRDGLGHQGTRMPSPCF